MRAVLFDAGNTLVYLDPVRMVELLRGYGADLELSGFRTLEFQARRRLHAGLPPGAQGTEPEVWREYFTDIIAGSGVPEDSRVDAGMAVVEVHRRDHLWTHVETGTPEVLQALRNNGFRLGVISNADGRMEALIERCGLREYFEFVVDSDRVGVAKPAAGIFHEGCRRMGLPPATCLYVGDLYPVDYLGAREAGLEAVVLDPLEIHGNRAPSISSLSELPAYLSARGHPAGVG
ncbi:MAG: HAD-IA family hydrolase [Gemmatimonadota bacterium]|nr:HAD-IA family hydrolase [Gemmatimonadota bacterium]